MSVLGDATIFASLIPMDALVEEEEVVGGHNLVLELPIVIGLGIGLGRAKYFVR